MEMELRGLSNKPRCTEDGCLPFGLEDFPRTTHLTHGPISPAQFAALLQIPRSSLETMKMSPRKNL